MRDSRCRRTLPRRDRGHNLRKYRRTILPLSTRLRTTHLSMYCTSIMYAMQAASSPSKCTVGFRTVVLMPRFLPKTVKTDSTFNLVNRVLSNVICGCTTGACEKKYHYCTVVEVELVELHAFQ